MSEYNELKENLRMVVICSKGAMFETFFPPSIICLKAAGHFSNTEEIRLAVKVPTKSEEKVELGRVYLPSGKLFREFKVDADRQINMKSKFFSIPVGGLVLDVLQGE